MEQDPFWIVQYIAKVNAVVLAPSGTGAGTSHNAAVKLVEAHIADPRFESMSIKWKNGKLKWISLHLSRPGGRSLPPLTTTTTTSSRRRRTAKVTPTPSTGTLGTPSVSYAAKLTKNATSGFQSSRLVK